VSDRPVVSAIIPTRNGERFLADAIESVLAQGYDPLELIVVDDGSTDGTAGVVGSYVSVRYVPQEHGGIGAARNRGVAEARGSLIAFLDSDDVWEEGKLRIQVGALERTASLSGVFGHVTEFLDPALASGAATAHRPPRQRFPGILPGTLLIRRQAYESVGDFGTEWRVGEWLDWYARAVEGGSRFEVIPEVVLRRRLHDGNQGIREKDSRLQYVQALKASLDRRRAAGRG